MAFEPGTRAGDYEILNVIGKGGMGCVYRVRNPLYNRIEAMKVLLSDFVSESQLGDRFLAEIRTVARLDHPHIARLHTAFQFEKQLVMVMEFVDGSALSDLSKKGPIPLPEILDYADQILSALAYAHQNGVIHRDIKPSNIMITQSGVAKLMDFGISKSAADPLKTSPGMTIGSLPYMSPEQVRNSEVDARSDIYSFGVLLYELTAGRVPFKSDTMFGVLDAHLNTPPKPPIELNPALPPVVNELILTALRKDPAQRFASAEVFRTALESVRAHLRAADPEFAPTLVDVPTPLPWGAPTEPLTAPPLPSPLPASPLPPPPPQLPPARGNRSLWMGAGALACVCILGGGVLMLPHFFKESAHSITNAPTQQQPILTTPAKTGTTDTGTAALSQPKRSPATATVAVRRPNPAPPVLTNRTAPAAPLTGESNLHTDTGVATPPVVTGSPAPASGPSQAELESAGDELMKLQSRATAVKNSLDNLRSQQAASGLGLRPDIASSASRMESYLQASDRALQAKNLESAKKYFDNADTEITKLESFFGR